MKGLLSAPLSSRKLVEYLLLFLLLASVLSAAAYGGYWYGKSSSKPEPRKPIVRDKSTSPSPQVPSEQAADWKTYKNEEYLYEIKYPKSWKVSETVNEEDANKGIANKTIKISDPKEPDNMFSIYVTNVAANESLDNLYTALSKFMVGDSPAALEDAKVGGVQAKRVLLYSGEVEIFSKISTNYFFNHNNLRWQINFPSRDEKGSHEAVFDQILPTFRFLDQSEAKGQAAEKMGFVKQTYEKNGKKYLVVDYVRWSTNEELKKTPNKWTTDIEGGEATLTVSAKVEVLVLGGSDGTTPTSATYNGFEKLVSSWSTGVLSTLTIENDQVAKIRQEYLP